MFNPLNSLSVFFAKVMLFLRVKRAFVKHQVGIYCAFEFNFDHIYVSWQKVKYLGE